MKIVTISDNPRVFTGLAKVHKNVIDGLMDAGHEVHPCIWYAHKTFDIDMAQKSQKPLPRLLYERGGKETEMFPVYKRGERAMYTAYEAIRSLKPDVVLTMGDYWDFYYMHAVKKQLDFSFKWVPYLTVEEEDVQEKFVPLFQYADAVAVPSLFGRETLGKIGIDAMFIPYGTDECFVQDSEARPRLRKDRGLADDDLRVISVGQNTSRKYLPWVLMIAKTLKDRGDYLGGIKFHVHTNITTMDNNEEYAFDLQDLVVRLGISDMVSFPLMNSIFDGVPDQDLVDEYNASDVFLSTSISEGYCLPVVEAMACGLPVVSTPMTTAFEHTGAKRNPARGDFVPSSVGPRGVLPASRLIVFPPGRLGRVMDAYDAATVLLDMRQQKQAGGILAGASAECVKYAKGRTWQAMKDDIVGLASGVPKSVTIPVEDI